MIWERVPGLMKNAGRYRNPALFVGENKGCVDCVSAIPFSMLFAFIGMREFGLAANLMSLGAIDFGRVVDGSVVMIENIVHKSPQENKIQVIRQAAFEVSRPIFFGVMIILMVYIPIMTFSGMGGILYRPMAITVATAVLGSLLLVLVFVPALYHWIERIRPKPATFGRDI